ncbi:MAG: hypothetical protein ACRDTC_23315 [Pseudonocardiaceae bacterium]
MNVAGDGVVRHLLWHCYQHKLAVATYERVYFTAEIRLRPYQGNVKFA